MTFEYAPNMVIVKVHPHSRYKLLGINYYYLPVWMISYGTSQMFWECGTNQINDNFNNDLVF